MESVVELEKKVAEIETSCDNFTAALGSLERQNRGVNGNLGVTVSSLPGAISLSSISHANSILTINGWSPSEAELLSYLRSLDASGWFSEITFTSIGRIDGEGVDFTLALGSLDKQNNGGNDNFKVIVNSLPSTVNLTSVDHANGVLTVNGWSPSEAEVLLYLRSLDNRGRFSEIIIASMKRVEDGEEGMDFTLIIRVGE